MADSICLTTESPRKLMKSSTLNLSKFNPAEYDKTLTNNDKEIYHQQNF